MSGNFRDDMTTRIDFNAGRDKHYATLSEGKLKSTKMPESRRNMFIETLRNPCNTKIGTPQFRLACRKNFKLDLRDPTIVYDTRKPGERPGTFARVVLDDEMYECICEVHAEVGHKGRDKTFEVLVKRYANIRKEVVAEFLKACPGCAAVRTVVGPPKGKKAKLAPSTPVKKPAKAKTPAPETPTKKTKKMTWAASSPITATAPRVSDPSSPSPSPSPSPCALGAPFTPTSSGWSFTSTPALSVYSSPQYLASPPQAAAAHPVYNDVYPADPAPKTEASTHYHTAMPAVSCFDFGIGAAVSSAFVSPSAARAGTIGISNLGAWLDACPVAHGNLSSSPSPSSPDSMNGHSLFTPTSFLASPSTSACGNATWSPSSSSSADYDYNSRRSRFEPESSPFKRTSGMGLGFDVSLTLGLAIGWMEDDEEEHDFEISGGRRMLF
ncbi:hypothetical protein JCM11251_001792 [Rhodosporidiobolus azoricus]